MSNEGIDALVAQWLRHLAAPQTLMGSMVKTLVCAADSQGFNSWEVLQKVFFLGGGMKFYLFSACE